MPRVKKTANEPAARKIRPALTPEAQENQMIAMAYDLVRQRLADGTASSQETTHFLKLGSARYKLELENLKADNQLKVAKAEAIQAEKEMAIAYDKVIGALQSYSASFLSSDDGEIIDEDI